MTDYIKQAVNSARELHKEYLESGKFNNSLIELSFIYENNVDFLNVVEGKGIVCKVKDLLTVEQWIDDVDIIYHNVENGKHTYDLFKIHQLWNYLKPHGAFFCLKNNINKIAKANITGCRLVW